MIDPEIGFTSDVIKDPNRFVGRTELIRSCIKAINTSLGLITVYGKRGVGKSSLLRQLQQMALGDYSIAKSAAIFHEVPAKPRKYLTAYYTCDSMISDPKELVKRLINDQDEEDGLLRLVPDDGKQLTEFSRTHEASGGVDLKVVNWGAKGIETSKYAKVVPDDIVQTFRNFVKAIVAHQVKSLTKRNGLLILLDEFDVINDKTGIGSLIKSLSSDTIKFAICGIGKDLSDLVEDHASVERLIQEGAINVKPMPIDESIEIISTAEKLFKSEITFSTDSRQMIADLSHGYPYFVQLIGKECVNMANQLGLKHIDVSLLNNVLGSIKCGGALPTLESQYQRAIGNSKDRQFLLWLLAEQPESGASISDERGILKLKEVRSDASDFNIANVDQLIPRLIDKNFGPVLMRSPEKPGIYEFVNPVFRLYVKLRSLD